MARVTSLIAVAALLGLLLVPTAAAPATAQAGLSGVVLSATAPVEDYTVTLYATNGAGDPLFLGVDQTGADGGYHIDYQAPADGAVVYVLAEGPPFAGAAALASVLGVAPVSATAVINERTTVATAYALAQFTEVSAVSGAYPGLQNAARMARNLADPITGEIGSVLAAPPNGSETSTLRTFNSLANALRACVVDVSHCATLDAVAQLASGGQPINSFQALVDIARNPGPGADLLFDLSRAVPPLFEPARAEAPSAWTLALSFVGDGMTMAGPGNFAVDHLGNLWVANNYEYNPDVEVPVCGSDLVLQFTPTGQYVQGSPWTGGGLSGAGFGIDIDPYGDVWVGNFGFAAAAPGCPADEQPAHNSVSQFRPDGTAVSPEGTGYTQGGVSWAQATVSDRSGNIWIANCGNDSVTVYPGGDPGQARQLTDIGLIKPFGIDHNSAGLAFVSALDSDNVALIGPDFVPLPGSPLTGGGLDNPMGVVVDSSDYVWVSNSGFVSLPCPAVKGSTSAGGSLTLISPDFTLTNFVGGGLTIPWGNTVDGDDNVWVANFGGKRLSAFCGTRPETCPAGLRTGDPISPDETGYDFDGLVRNTGVAVDQSGNVWLANNWKEIPLQTNPGGYEIVAFVGLAAPKSVPAPIDRPAPKPAPTTGPKLPPVVGPKRPAFTG
jgi:hypothetical protein